MGDFSSFVGGVNDVLGVATSATNLFGRKHREEREDTAVQRRVNDLKAAGLSPTLAAGSAASSEPMLLNGPRVGAAADASLKEASKELQNQQKSVAEQTLDNLTQVNTINKPAELTARNEMATLSHILNSQDGTQYSNAVRATMLGKRQNEALLYEKANRMNVPVEFLMSGPGQQVMLNNYIRGLPPLEKARFMANLAVMGMAQNAGPAVSGVINKSIPSYSITEVRK